MEYSFFGKPGFREGWLLVANKGDKAELMAPKGGNRAGNIVSSLAAGRIRRCPV